MRSIREIFVAGNGPSSSHTMGPSFAVDYILNKYEEISYVECTLYESLALTGKGHLTDYIIDKKLGEIPHKIIFDLKTKVEHPNTMLFKITCKNGIIYEEPVISIGGGTIVTKDKKLESIKETYPHNSLNEILNYCKENNLTLHEYVLKYEGKEIIDYLYHILEVIETARQNGIEATGELPGELHVKRKARTMYLEMRAKKDGKTNIHMNVAISSFAVAEENASGGLIVIAPTCGSAGVIPGVITYLKMKSFSNKDLVKGLMVAGLIGILCKTNGSVSGAEAGCQAEIGVACAMGAAMVSATFDTPNENIAQAAEIGLEHSLGLTCDPVKGYVQVPCIERCAMFALKAISAATLAKLLPDEDSIVDFDTIVKTMYHTGKDIPQGYRETSVDGLAKHLNK